MNFVTSRNSLPPKNHLISIVFCVFSYVCVREMFNTSLKLWNNASLSWLFTLTSRTSESEKLMEWEYFYIRLHCLKSKIAQNSLSFHFHPHNNNKKQSQILKRFEKMMIINSFIFSQWERSSSDKKKLRKLMKFLLFSRLNLFL